MKKLEYPELKAMGCTTEALELKYNGSDSVYFLSGEKVIEKIRGVEFVCELKINDFLKEFNNIDDFNRD